MTEIIERIFREVMELDETEELYDDMSADNLEEWDSLASMSLVIQLEKKFAIKFEFDDVIQMDSLGSVKRVVMGKVQ